MPPTRPLDRVTYLHCLCPPWGFSEPSSRARSVPGGGSKRQVWGAAQASAEQSPVRSTARLAALADAAKVLPHPKHLCRLKALMELVRGCSKSMSAHSVKKGKLLGSLRGWSSVLNFSPGNCVLKRLFETSQGHAGVIKKAVKGSTSVCFLSPPSSDCKFA